MKTLKRLFILAFIIAAVSCNKHSHAVVNIPQMEITYISSRGQLESCVPATLVSYGDWSMIEITDPDEYDNLTMLYMNGAGNMSFVVAVKDNSVTFSSYGNFLSESWPGEIMSVVKGDSDIILYVSSIDSMSGDLESVYSVSLDDLKTKADYFEDFELSVRKDMAGFFNSVGDEVGKLGDLVGLLPGAGRVSMIPELYKDVFMPMVSAMVYPDAENLVDVGLEQVNTASGKYLMNYISMQPGEMPEMYLKVKKYLDVYNNYFEESDYDDTYFDNCSDEQMEEISESVFRRSEWSHSMICTMAEEHEKFSVSVSVSDITETGFCLSGSAIANSSMAFYSEAGFRYYSAGGAEREVLSDNLNKINVNGLEPCTKYYAYAFLYSNGMEYKSKIISFMTLGDFKVSPTELQFYAKGGSQEVKVSYNSNTVKSWDVTSKPKWCTIGKSGSSFTVSVKKSGESRRGSITVAATLTDGKEITETIAVAQDVPPAWDAGIWQGSGNGERKYEGSNRVEEFSFSFTMNITSPESGKYSVTINDIEMAAYCNSDGQLVATYDLTYSPFGGIGKYREEYVFTRLTVDEAVGTFNGSDYEEFDFLGQPQTTDYTFTGEVTATRKK